MKRALLVLSVCGAAATSFGAFNATLAWGGGPYGAVYLRDGVTVLPSGNVACVVWSPDAVNDPPLTNTPGCLAAGEVLSTHPDAGGRSGIDYVTRLASGDGLMTAVVQNNMKDSGYGYLRAFSGRSVAASAYYADSAVKRLEFDAMGAMFILPNATCALVNPAYAIPLTVTVKPSEPVWAGSARLEGSVAAQGGNNELDPGQVTVIWSNRLNGAQGVFPVDARGVWSGNVTVATDAGNRGCVNEVMVTAVGQSARPGLPSSKPVVVSITVRTD